MSAGDYQQTTAGRAENKLNPYRNTRENGKKIQEDIQTFEGVGLEGVLRLEGVCRRLLSTAVVEHGYL